jgi:hypothetical protein
MDALTSDQKLGVILQIFEDYKYMGGINVLRKAAPDAPPSEIVEFVRDCFNHLVDRVEV